MIGYCEKGKVEKTNNNSDGYKLTMADIRIDRIKGTKFYTGKLGELDVIVDKNGYMNGSKLATSAGKKLSNWTQLKSTESFKQTVISMAGIPAIDLEYTVKGGNHQETWGTYMHPELMIKLAMWCSDSYAMLVTRVMLAHQSRKTRALLAARDAELEDREDTITELRAMMARMEAKMEKDSKRRVDAERKADTKMEKMDSKLDHVNGKLDTVKGQLVQVEGHLVKAKRTRVLTTGKREYENLLLIWKLNQDPDDFGDNEIPFEYAASRLTEQSLATTMAKKLQEYPRAEIVLEVKGTPSAMALWRYYKKRYGRKIEWEGCNFYLHTGYTEERMIRDIQACHVKRMTNKGL